MCGHEAVDHLASLQVDDHDVRRGGPDGRPECVTVAARVDVAAVEAVKLLTSRLASATLPVMGILGKAFNGLRTVEAFKEGTWGARKVDTALMGELMKHAPQKAETVEQEAEKRDA